MPDTDITQRPAWACATCRPPTGTRTWRRADDPHLVCDSCADRIPENLFDVAKRYLALDPTPGGSADNGGRGTPGFGSRSPASDHVIAMRDPRSSETARVWVASDGKVHREAEYPPLSAFSVLDTVAWSIAEARGYGSGHGQDDVSGLCSWLDRQLDWALRDPIIIDLDEAVRALLGQLRPVTGDRRRRIGSCPNVIDEGEHTRECGGPLFAPTAASADATIRCRACGRAWPRTEWLRLGELLDA